MALNLTNTVANDSIFKISAEDGDVIKLSGQRETTGKPTKPFEVVVDTGGSGEYTTIAAALSYLGSSAGTIQIKAGTYTITTAITLGAEQHLLGSGFGTKILTTSNITMISSSSNRASVSHLRLVGNNTGSSQVGINMSGNECTIRDCWVIDMGGKGILMTGDNILVTGCRIDHCTGRCLEITGDWFRVSDCYINDSAVDGIQLTGTLGGAITGCQIMNHGDDGIQMTSCTQNQIVGNYIFSNGDNNTNGNGIQVGICQDTIIVGNVIHTNDGVGVDISASSNKTVLVSNSLLNNEDGTHTDAGTGSVIDHNAV